MVSWEGKFPKTGYGSWKQWNERVNLDNRADFRAPLDQEDAYVNFHTIRLDGEHDRDYATDEDIVKRVAERKTG